MNPTSDPRSFLPPRPQRVAQRRTISRRGQPLAEVWCRPGTSDEASLRQIFELGSYDLRRLPHFGEIERRYLEITRAGRHPLIVDAGANIGLASLFFTEAWPEAQIVAVEPAEDNFELLRQNTAARPVASVHAGLSRTEGFLRVADAQAEKWAYQTERTEAETPGAVRATTVTTLLSEWPKERGYDPFIAKFDVEGAEAEIFSCDTAWIDAFSVIVIELHDWLLPGRGHSRPVLRALVERNRDFLLLGENIVSVANRL